MFLFFIVVADHVIIDILFFFLMIRRPPRSTRTDNSFPTRRSSDLSAEDHGEADHDQQRLQQCPGQSDEGLLVADRDIPPRQDRSEEHTSELQSLMRISYAVFCLKQKKPNK